MKQREDAHTYKHTRLYTNKHTNLQRGLLDAGDTVTDPRAHTGVLVLEKLSQQAEAVGEGDLEGVVEGLMFHPHHLRVQHELQDGGELVH